MNRIAGLVCRAQEEYAKTTMKSFAMRQGTGWKVFSHNEHDCAVVSARCQGTQSPAVLTTENSQIILVGGCYEAMGLKNNADIVSFLKKWHEKYRDAPASGLSEIKGAFCFIIMDYRQHSVLVAIDRMGIYPLAYHHGGDILFFASTVDMVLEISRADNNLNAQSIYDYMFFHMVPSPCTIYHHVKKLEPGQYLYFHDGKIHADFYWKPVFQEHKPKDEEQQADELKYHLTEAVSRCGLSDNTGAFLSGGLDSSTVVGFASQIKKSPLPVFSIGFDAPGYDETEYARIVAEAYSAQAHEYYVTPEDIQQVVRDIAARYDEPFGNSSAIPVYFCAKLASDTGISRLLAGDGGDELFGGNSRYVKQLLFERYLSIPSSLRNFILDPLGLSLADSPRDSLRAKFSRYVRDSNMPLPERLHRYNFMKRIDISDMLHPDFLDEIDVNRPLSHLHEIDERCQSRVPLNRMLYMDWKITLADNDLRKVNWMCDANGIEVCYPMLDDSLVEFSTKIPSNLKIKNGKLRYFYKRSLSSFLPRPILEKKKHGFGLPFGVWMKEDNNLKGIALDCLHSLSRKKYLKDSFVNEIFKRHEAEHASYYGETIWVLMMLELWMDTHGHK